MAKLTPHNSRSAQMMTRAAGKGMLVQEPATPGDPTEPKDADSQPTTTVPEGPRFGSLVDYPDSANATSQKADSWLMILRS